jgi:pimeloyl-ACP methyl ester carboxylesterase
MSGELVGVGGVQLYAERRGAGPPLLFIPGGGMDGSHFVAVAEKLADFDTVTYDRRGYHRSPAPPDWTDTTIDQHADDVAGLIRALGIAPAAVWGGSIGGIILLNLLRRHPDLVRSAIIHEPPLFTLLDDEPKFRAGLAGLHERAKAEGARVVMAEHAEAELGGAFTSLDSVARERMLDNAAAFLLRDIPGLTRSLPTPETLGSRVPTAVMRSPENTHTPPGRAAAELALRLGVPLEFTPGGHIPHVTEPAATATTLRALLNRLA